jgi:hypothetical protein
MHERIVARPRNVLLAPDNPLADQENAPSADSALSSFVVGTSICALTQADEASVGPLAGAARRIRCPQDRT